jgi:hypothetical protein
LAVIPAPHFDAQLDARLPTRNSREAFFIKGVMSGLAWMTKILTDPFHDIALYHQAPLHLLRGEWIDPMVHVRHG